MEVKLFFDGASGPINPGGHIGIGCYVISGTGELLAEHSEVEPSNPNNTNNVAEYKALIRGLKSLMDLGLHKKADDIYIYGDSMLVIQQMKGKWSIKSGYYAQWAKEAKQMTKSFTANLHFNWISRDLNNRADDLSKGVLRSIGIETANY